MICSTAHPQIACDLEILADPVRDAYRYLKHQALVSGGKAYGFKVKIYQLDRRQGIEDAAVFLQRMHADGWRIVYLQRRNLFRHAYSGLARKVRGTPHTRARTDGSAPPRPRVRLDVAQTLRLMRKRHAMQAREQAALKGLPYKTLVYEDDLYSPDYQQRAISELLEWLGLVPEPVDTALIPNTPPNLREVIENCDEVEAGLRGTEFEGYFREATGS